MTQNPGAGTMDRPETGTQTILVVDDEPSILMMVRYALEPEGYVVRGAYSAREALDMFAEQHGEIDLVILDFMLPDMLGDELMGRMLEIDDTKPFIAASGCSEQEVAQEMRSGAVCFIRKPFDLKALPGQIDAALVERVR